MPSISPFQRLPLHIAETIVRYHVCTCGEGNYLYYQYSEGKRVWTVLHNVSYSWRLLARQFFFSELTIYISTTSGTGRLVFAHLPDVIEVDTVPYNYAKRVNIESTSVDEPSRFKLQDLSPAWPEDLTIPSVRHLHVSLSGLVHQAIDKRSTDSNEIFDWISERIQTSMPKLQEVTISDENPTRLFPQTFPESKCKADAFLSTVFGRATSFNVKTSTVNLTSDLSFVQNGTGLTSLEIAYDYEDSLFSNVIAKSASTLESLEYDNTYLHNVRSLVFDSEHRPIVYPRLRRLTVYNYEGYVDGSLLRMDKSVAPFPVLRRLKWHSMYIFEDDAMFRGNGSTLEYLYIEADTGLADVLRKHKVFSLGKHSRLGYVSVHCSGPDHGVQVNSDGLIRFAAGFIVPATKSLSIMSSHLRDVVHSMSTIPHLGNIQVLSLTRFRGGLADLLDIVKLFPNMTRFTCSPGTIDLEPDSMLFSEFVNGIYTQHYPLNRRLRHWEAVPEFMDEERSLPQTALAMTILCTDLVLATIPSECIADFGHMIQNAIASGLYDRHIDKIQRILRIVN